MTIADRAVSWPRRPLVRAMAPLSAQFSAHLSMFAIIATWQVVGVAAVRLYAQESAAAMVPAGLITAFWFSDTKLCHDWSLMPAAVLGAALGTFIGVNLGLGGVL